MPWSGPTFHKHNHSLTPAQSTHAAHIANAVLKRSGDEEMAIAVANKYAARASGGGMQPASNAPLISDHPGWLRQQSAPHHPATGFLSGATPGRADALHTKALSGSYVFPADVVAAAGEGNSLAGAKVLQKMLGTGPYGTALTPMSKGMGMPHRADGGGLVDVALSDGELVATPEQMAALGGGDIRRGHKIADALVLELRRRHILKLKKLPAPVGAKSSK